MAVSVYVLHYRPVPWRFPYIKFPALWPFMCNRLFFVIRGNETLLKTGFLPGTLLMKTSKPRVADIVRAVAETLDVICIARGIEVRDLDEASINKLLWSAYEEHLGDGTSVSDTSWCEKRP
jgi:hypothetical protein